MTSLSKAVIGASALIVAAALIVTVATRGVHNGAVANGASLTLTAPVSGTIDAGQTQTVSWNAENYGASTVDVALIRKVSDNPARYELVRVIAPAKTNN